MTQQVVPHESHLPARTDEYDAFGTVPKEDLILPVRKLVQGVSRVADSKKAGEFYDLVTGEYFPSLRVAILAISKSRSLFDQADFESPPVCVSDNAVRPREQVEVNGTTTGPTCAECPFSQWGSATGRGQACRESHNLLCYDLGTGEAFKLRVTGVGIAPWRNYLTACRMRRVSSVGYKTLIGSEEQIFTAGKAWVPTFKLGGALSKEFIAQARRAAAAYRGVSLGVEGEDEPAGLAEDTEVEEPVELTITCSEPGCPLTLEDGGGFSVSGAALCSVHYQAYEETQKKAEAALVAGPRAPASLKPLAERLKGPQH